MILDRTNRYDSARPILGPCRITFTRGDCLVVNNTAVVPARFFLRRATGGRIEGLFLNRTDAGLWEVLLKGASRLKIDEVVGTTPAPGGAMWLRAVIFRFEPMPSTIRAAGYWNRCLTEDHVSVLRAVGITPLPPYIHRSDSSHDIDERDHYQTVYARHPGSAAAPDRRSAFHARAYGGLACFGYHDGPIDPACGIGHVSPGQC